MDETTEALELAAGSGAMTLSLCKRFKPLLATDFSSRMIEIVRERVGAAGATKPRFAVMGGRALEQHATDLLPSG